MKIRADIEEQLTINQAAEAEIETVFQQKLSWFQDQKIGVIFHFGLYSQAGIVESWQLSEADDWARQPAWREDLVTLRKEYWALNRVFNPTAFNPDDWAEKCQQAGFRYMIFTTKHHDGFNLFDTQASNYKITAEECPFHTHAYRDIFKAVTTSFRKVGLATGAYYSKADWASPDYWAPDEQPTGRYASYDPLLQPERWRRFSAFVEKQLIELCSNYGQIDILWLDAGWVNKGNEQLNMPSIVAKLRQKQPQMLLVDRTIGGPYEQYVTPERKIPEKAPAKAWESNLPLANNWGYVPNDHYKSFYELLKSLLQIVSMGGNVILGIGPKPDGTLPQEAIQLMKQLGLFLADYGEGIYDTRPLDNLTIEGWYFTKKAQYLYGYSIREKAPHAKLKVAELKCLGKIKKIIFLKTKQQLPLNKEQLEIPFEGELVVALKFYLS